MLHRPFLLTVRFVGLLTLPLAMQTCTADAQTRRTVAEQFQVPRIDNILLEGNAHVCVERCTLSRFAEYVCKYVTKAADEPEILFDGRRDQRVDVLQEDHAEKILRSIALEEGD